MYGVWYGYEVVMGYWVVYDGVWHGDGIDIMIDTVCTYTSTYTKCSVCVSEAKQLYSACVCVCVGTALRVWVWAKYDEGDTQCKR